MFAFVIQNSGILFQIVYYGNIAPLLEELSFSTSIRKYERSFKALIESHYSGSKTWFMDEESLFQLSSVW
jgi:hypothetical protein